MFDDKLGQHIERFLESYRSAHTRRAYGRDLAEFASWSRSRFAELELALTPTGAKHWANQLASSGLSARSARRRYAAVRSFGDWLVRHEVVLDNPYRTHDFKPLVEVGHGSAPAIALSRAEYGRILESAARSRTSGMRDVLTIRILAECALRRSDVCQMDTEHLDNIDAFGRIEPIEQGSDFRKWICLSAELLKAMRDYRRQHCLESGPVWRSMSRSSLGHRLTPHSIYRIVRGAAERAGLPNIGAHTLRHTGCTLAIESGASLQQVQAHARHKKLETTMTYIHQRDRLRESAADYIKIKK